MFVVTKSLALLLILLSVMATASMAVKDRPGSAVRRGLTGSKDGDAMQPSPGKGGGTGKKGKKSSDRVYFESMLAMGEEEIIFESGPIQVRAACEAYDWYYYDDLVRVALKLKLEWPSDILVFGDIDYDGGLDNSPIEDHVLLANTTYDEVMWDVHNGSGNDIDDGAVWTSTGDYFGWNGEQVIGLAEWNSTDLELVGDEIGKEINCIVAGHFDYISSH